MRSLLKLSLQTVLSQKSGVLALVLVLCVPFVFREMTNYDVNPSLAAAALAQAAWQCAWIVSVLWGLYMAAGLGGEHVRSRMGEYFFTCGLVGGGQLTALWLCCMTFVGSLCFAPVLVCLITVGPESGVLLQHWWVLCLQHLVFMLVVLSGVVLFVLALASRFGSIVGYVSGVGLVFSGVYLVKALEKIVRVKDEVALDLLYSVLPHFYLADLTHRFVHMHGAMSTLEFMRVFEYLAGWTIVLSVLATVIFNPNKK